MGIEYLVFILADISISAFYFIQFFVFHLFAESLSKSLSIETLSLIIETFLIRILIKKKIINSRISSDSVEVKKMFDCKLFLGCESDGVPPMGISWRPSRSWRVRARRSLCYPMRLILLSRQIEIWTLNLADLTRNFLFYHEDLQKRERVWCCGARETREPRFTIGWLLPKENIFSNLPALQDLDDWSLQ